jgi:hypothetical protein
MILDNLDEIYQEVLEELSYRVGIVNLKDAYHFAIFNELLKESELEPYSNLLIKSLFEADAAEMIWVKKKDSGNLFQIQKGHFDANTHILAKSGEVKKQQAKQTEPTKAEKPKKQTKVSTPKSKDTEKTDDDIAGNSSAKEFTKKSETTEGLFSGKNQYKKIQTPNKEYVVRQLIDPETNEPIDTSSPEGRKKAIKIVGKRLEELKEKSARAVKALGDKTLNKPQRQLIHKWLGEYGEMQAYNSLLNSDKVKDAFLFTDSEVKNDILVIGNSDDERTIVAWGVSVKAAQQDTMANKRGSSVKPDFDKALDGAETRELTLDGVDENVDAGIVLNSMLEIRKQLIKRVSDGKARQDTKTGSTFVKLDNGKEVLITEFFREQKVTEEDVDAIFDNPSIVKSIRGLSGENIEDPEQLKQLTEYFRQKYKGYVKDGVSIKEMENKMVEDFVGVFDKVGANLTPSTDVMISYYDESGFTENRFITKEDSEKKILDFFGVDDFNDIPKADQLKNIMGLDFTGRGMGDKKSGNGFIDGQSFGRPNKNLQPDNMGMDEYLDKHFPNKTK